MSCINSFENELLDGIKNDIKSIMPQADIFFSKALDTNLQINIIDKGANKCSMYFSEVDRFYLNIGCNQDQFYIIDEIERICEKKLIKTNKAKK